MKTLIKAFGALFLAALAIAGCENPAAEEPVKIRLNKELITDLPVGSTQTLVATLTPADAEVTVVWSSDDENVAVVNDEGAVTGVAPGTAVISARVDKEVATCKVTVTAVKPSKIALSSSSLELQVDAQHTLEVILTPSNAVAEDIEWSSTDPSVVSVEKSGLVTALKEGNATITVKCSGGLLAATCHVKVVAKEEEVKVTAIALKPSSLTLEEGQKGTLEVVVTPDNAVVEDLEWETSDAEVASVADGEVTAHKAGEAVITVKCNGGTLSATCDVTVREKAVTPPDHADVKAVVLFAEGNASDLQVGKSLQLTARYDPADAKPNSVSWTVDRTDLASVDQNGLITGVSTVKGSDGNWPKVTVTVTADEVSTSMSLMVIPRQPDAIEVDLPENNQLRIGDNWDFNPRILPEGLEFSVIVVGNDPSGRMLTSDSMTASYPGLYSFTFSISDHDDLVNSYKVLKNVSVSVNPYWVETVSLPETQEMELGASMNIVPSFTSDVAGVEPTYKDVKWSSSDPSIVSVNEKTGELKANAAGSAVITATTCHDWSVPSGTAHKSASCTVTVNSSGSSFNIGDYYYSDGTWSSELQAGKTVVGVIFAKVNAASSDARLAQDYPGCTHGLVLGLAEYADQDFGSVSTYNGHGYYAGLGYDANLIVDEDKPNGYSNTLAHKDLNASKSDYCKFFNAADGVIAVHSAAVAAPSSSSSWYIPSYKEMNLINENMAVVNEAINAAGGTPMAEPYENEASWDENRSSDWYWTSTIKGVWYERGKSYDHYKHPYDLSKGGWTTSQQSSGNFKVRVVLAF